MSSLIHSDAFQINPSVYLPNRHPSMAGRCPSPTAAPIRPLKLLNMPSELITSIASYLSLRSKMMLSKTCTQLNILCSPNPISKNDLSRLLMFASKYNRHKHNIPCFTCETMRFGRPLLQELTPAQRRQDEVSRRTEAASCGRAAMCIRMFPVRPSPDYIDSKRTSPH